MPRPRKGPRLGGSPSREKLMLANLATEPFIHEKVAPTEAQAEAVRPRAGERDGPPDLFHPVPVAL